MSLTSEHPAILPFLIGEILRTLGKDFDRRVSKLKERISQLSAFELLVLTILSQNTSSTNTQRAYKNLKSKVGRIAPERILSISLEELEAAIKPAGMQRVRARKLRKLAEIIIERGIRLEDFGLLEVEEVRRELKNLPGVGDKTADILLLFYFRKPVMPVDTHIMRVMRRLGFASSAASYNHVSKLLAEACNYDPDKILYVHLAIIEFGRKICRARNPLCDKCPLLAYCTRARTRTDKF